MSKKMNGAQAFFKTLTDGGIDTVFGCPGTSEMQIIEELGQTDMTAVLGLPENRCERNGAWIRHHGG